SRDLVSPFSFAFSPDKNRFALIDVETKKVGIWDFKSCKKLFDLNKSQPEPYSIAYDAHGKRIAVGSGNQKIINTITIWDENTGKHIRDLITGYNDVTVFPLAFNTDGSKLAAAVHYEGGAIVIIWDDLTQQ